MDQSIEKPGLLEQLDSFKARLVEMHPEATARYQASIDDLVSTGIAAQSMQVGEQAPDFTLSDAIGQQVVFADLLKQGPVVVAFYRGQWCPYCNLQLRAYQQILPQIKALGATLVAISPQTPDQSLSTVEKDELAFTVLSDVGNRVARQYRLVFSLSEDMRPYYLNVGNNLPVFNGDDSWELPVPGTFLIDQSGVVRFTFVDADYTRRLEPATLLEHLRVLVEERVV